MNNFSFTNSEDFKGQNYFTLQRQLAAAGQRFVDPFFPPQDSSLFPITGKNKGIEWKRAQDIDAEARLFVNGISSRDIIQGDLGNCWLVAALCTLAVHKNNWQRVIPEWNFQDWPSNKTGLFHFRFWRFGRWVNVVVDDFLPVKKGRLVFCHSPDTNEFWPALVEKAYAKLYGSYEALNGGELAEALEDFTGGVTENIEIEEEGLRKSSKRSQEFFEYLNSFMNINSLLCAAIPALTPQEMEKRTKMGLVKGHAYAITKMQVVRTKAFMASSLRMVRMKNPWGGVEWNGPFSDKSSEWKQISPGDRKQMGLVFDDDGEFWMTFDDFINNYENVAVCHVVDPWTHKEFPFLSSWTLPHLAGGCINNKETFLQNPQFLLGISSSSGDEVMIQLLQMTEVNPGEDRLTIGFTIMQVENNRKYRTHQVQKIITNSTFKDSRSIFLRYKLNKGRYIIIPSIFEAGIEGSFLLRVFTDSSSFCRALNKDQPVTGVLGNIPWPMQPTAVTQIKVMKANNLHNEEGKESMNLYCVIKCGKKKVKSLTLKEVCDPEFNLSAIFFRKKAAKEPITVEVWKKNFLMDQLLGKQVLFAAEEMNQNIVDLPLVIKDLKGNRINNGQVQLALTTSYDLSKL